ncbi:MAG: hypothetical protein Q3994_06980 [Prevotella sp.]|nr:hypothetical protein [Prevotella sp.]
MKNFRIILCAISVFAFSSCKQKNDDTLYFLQHNSESTIADSIAQDSIERAIVAKEEQNVESGTEIRNTYSAPQNSISDDDNMRGFDPRSEDDMDDNGMSRYMDNYDDEGWE